MSSESGPSGTEAPLPKRTPRCPKCDAPSSAIRRWPQSPEVWSAACTRCKHAWLEASRRSIFDTLFHSGDLLVFGLMVGVASIGLGILVVALLAPILGASDAAAFITTIALCVASLIVIGRMRTDS